MQALHRGDGEADQGVDRCVGAASSPFATVDEAADVAAEVRSRGLAAGIMVETPAAALLADRILEVVDFVSIGTNDLAQCTMAADRLATDLAHLTDPWQPVVLRWWR
ncbi:putative PEP-binding protein [Lentzea sp. NBRC 102530]|uniref:putative PEP-binding protein n=1 Tax=Lentzea sp. NBRC 102530 TaxID=3032201 RepID=UPI00332BB62A